MSYLYRCSRKACEARQARKKAPGDYVRIPRCRYCGSPLRVDWWQMRRNKQGLCRCDGLWFSMKGAPHRKGSKGCIHDTRRISHD